jgi:hypothetical protein
VRLITYRAEAVALVVHGNLALFATAVEELGADDPLHRFTAAMCRLAMELELGLAGGVYEEQRAQAYARELLMPEGEFAALAWLPDPYPATCFGVPPEQVKPRQLELRLRAATPD